MDNFPTGGALGHQTHNWWNEALHGGACRTGYGFSATDRYGGPLSPQTVYEVFNAVSDEARAKIQLRIAGKLRALSRAYHVDAYGEYLP